MKMVDEMWLLYTSFMHGKISIWGNIIEYTLPRPQQTCQLKNILVS